MQAISENKFKKIIERKNSAAYIRFKIIVKFSFLFIIGFGLGLGFFNTIVDDRSVDIDTISKHFDSIFVNCETISDYLITMLAASRSDIRHLLFIFISGFTYFCFIASGAIIFSRGLLMGFSSAYIIYAFEVNSQAVTPFMVIIYILSNIISSAILIHISVLAYIFSFDFRAIKRNNSILRRASITYRYSFFLILSLSGILINNLIYCIITSFI